MPYMIPFLNMGLYVTSIIMDNPSTTGAGFLPSVVLGWDYWDEIIFHIMKATQCFNENELYKMIAALKNVSNGSSVILGALHRLSVDECSRKRWTNRACGEWNPNIPSDSVRYHHRGPSKTYRQIASDTIRYRGPPPFGKIARRIASDSIGWVPGGPSNPYFREGPAVR